MSLSEQFAVAVILLFVGFGTGWQVHGKYFQAAQVSQTKTSIKTAAKLEDETKPIIDKRDAKIADQVIVYRTIKEKANATPDNRVCFTNESLSLWNHAIAGTDPNRSQPAGKTDTADTVEPEQKPTATAREVINNGADNFQTCNANSLKHNALIDKIESLKGKMCVCGK